MRIIMDTFDALKFPRLHGVVKPDGFSRWEAWDKTAWVVRNGHAADLLEAMESLKAAGEWPSEEELGMVGGRGLMPAVSIAAKRAVPVTTHAPAPRGAVPVRVVPSSGPRRSLRRDRLKDYY